jgi:Spy/CpxP family protein refolding chaperone
MRLAADPIRDQIRQARDDTVGIVINDPFDEAAFDRQVKKINDLRLQMADILKKAAKELPPDQRRALGETMKRPSLAASQ